MIFFFFVFLACMLYWFWRMYKNRIAREENRLYQQQQPWVNPFPTSNDSPKITHPKLKTEIPSNLRNEIQDILKTYEEEELQQKEES